MKPSLSKVLLGALPVVVATLAHVPSAARAETSPITDTAVVVQATVTATCNLLTPVGTVDFGNVDTIGAGPSPAALTANGSFELQCNKGAAPSVELNAGSNPSGSQKRMTNGSDFLNYTVRHPATGFITCQPAGVGTDWTSANDLALASAFASSGGPKTVPFCVEIPRPQPVQSGDYSDTITMTITF